MIIDEALCNFFSYLFVIDVRAKLAASLYLFALDSRNENVRSTILRGCVESSQSEYFSRIAFIREMDIAHDLCVLISCYE